MLLLEALVRAVVDSFGALAEVVVETLSVYFVLEFALFSFEECLFFELLLVVVDLVAHLLFLLYLLLELVAILLFLVGLLEELLLVLLLGEGESLAFHLLFCLFHRLFLLLFGDFHPLVVLFDALQSRAQHLVSELFCFFELLVPLHTCLDHLLLLCLLH